ncbi:hypothetical protein [Acidovorax sp. SUPP3334]|uniref:hypothetical protein n=1 Tax=Acidovorax sp. SUPP3334 TaxID=2920881 RepID=UPI0024E082C3|nr:hypothetical protein [Acidovorax sp. SUPP3334]
MDIRPSAWMRPPLLMAPALSKTVPPLSVPVLTTEPPLADSVPSALTLPLLSSPPEMSTTVPEIPPVLEVLPTETAEPETCPPLDSAPMATMLAAICPLLVVAPATSSRCWARMSPPLLSAALTPMLSATMRPALDNVPPP